MSFFSNLSRKEKRKFNNMSPEEQAPIIQAELIRKIDGQMGKIVQRDIQVGMDLVWTSLYNDFVSEYDSAKYEDQYIIVENLMSKIRTQYLRIEKEKKEAENKK